MVSVPVGCSDLFASIDCFDWYKIYLKLFFHALFFLLLNFVHLIYWIRVHWSWNLYLGVVENCQCDVSKPDIHVWYLHRFVEGCDEGASFCDFTCHHQYTDCIQVNHTKFSKFVFVYTSFSSVRRNTQRTLHHSLFINITGKISSRQLCG